jgi:hypothetical protein
MGFAPKGTIGNPFRGTARKANKNWQTNWQTDQAVLEIALQYRYLYVLHTEKITTTELIATVF